MEENSSTNPPEPQPMATMADLDKAIEANKQAMDQDKGNALSTPDNQPPAVQGQADDPITRVLSDTGFKTVDDLVKSQKEGHATITRLSQEKAAMQRELEAAAQFAQWMTNQMQAQQPQTPTTQQSGQADSLTAELYKDMAPFITQEVERRATEIASQIVDNKLTMRELSAKVNAKRSENPEEFDELRPIMANVLKSYPQYEMHPDGLNVVYDMAKKVRESRINKITQTIFGPDISLDKVREAIRQVMGGQPAAPAPTSTGAYVPPAGSNTPPLTTKPVDYDAQIKQMLGSERKIERNDPDKVLDLWWQKVNEQAQAQAKR